MGQRRNSRLLPVGELPLGRNVQVAFVLFLWASSLGVSNLRSQIVPGVPPRPPNQSNDSIDSDDPEDEVERILADTFLQTEQSVFVPAPRDFLRPLIRASRAIRENDTSRAVSLLGEVLSDSTGEDYLVPMTGVEGVSVSLRLRAQTILGMLPAKDRELYRLRYGVQAKQLLEKAIEESDFTKISQVMQRFFYTDAGFDAAMLLGHYHLDQGRPIAAANCFQRIVDSPEGRVIHDPEASVLLATCWMLGESTQRATDVLVQLRARSNQAAIEFQGRPVRMFDRPEDATAWLRKLIGDSPLRNNELVNQWVMVGGNPQRNARSGTGFPLLNPRWVARANNNPDISKAVVEQQRDLIFLDSAPIPAVQPLAVGDTVVMRSFDRMIGVDFETGKRTWVFPPWDFATKFTSESDRLKPTTIGAAPLTERLWLDAIYGQASSDGEKVFVVPKPGFSDPSGPSISGDAEPALQREYNELMAINIAREGAFCWQVGGESGLDEPGLAKTFFLGPPLPMQGELFAICQQGSEVRLVVLDAGTGKLKWLQQLGTTETTSVKLRRDRYRRLAGVTPSFADGILVCATGTGALVGVDLSTRSLLWGHQYATPGRKAVQPISPGRTSNADPLNGLWRDSSIVIAEGKVFFTPVDAQDLICVDLQTGLPTWPSAIGASAKAARQDSLFLACVEKGRAILVGETSVRAINVKTGKTDWEQPLDSFGKPSGRGYTNSGVYYFPTTAEKLVQIDLEKGTVLKSVRTNGVLGNLICYRGDVISHGVDRVSVFPQDQPNLQRVATARSAGELTPELLALQSQLQLQDGQLKEAVLSIEKAYQREPNRAYENLLLDLIIRLVADDFDEGIEFARRHESELMAQRRFDFLAAKINGMIRNQKSDRALDSMFALLQPDSDVDLGEFLDVSGQRYDAVQPGVGLLDASHPGNHQRISVRLDRWVASRIKLIYAESNAQDRSTIESRIEDLFQSYRQSGPLERHALMRIFPLPMIAESTRSELAGELLSAGEPLRAVELLTSLADSQDPQVAATTAGRFAQCYVDRNMTAQALPWIRRLGSQFGSTQVGDQQTGSELASSLADQLGADDQLGAEDQSSLSKIHFGNEVLASSESGVDTANGTLIPCTVELESYDNPEYATFQYKFYGQTGEIEILDANGESMVRFLARQSVEPFTTVYNNYVFGRISIQDNLAVVDIATEVFIFDWLKMKSGDDPMLWNSAIRSTEKADPASNSVSRMWQEVGTKSNPRNYEFRVFTGPVGFAGICYLEGTQLVCVDPWTGLKIWQRSNVLPGSRLHGDQDHVMIWNAKLREAKLVQASDGRLVKTTILPPEAGSLWKFQGCQGLLSSVRKPTPAVAVLPEKSEAEAKKTQTSRESLPPTMVRSLGLYDMLHDQLVWQSEFPLTSKGCLVGPNQIAIFPQKGDLEFYDLRSGKLDYAVPVSLQLGERARIDGLGVAIQNGKYLIHLKKGDAQSRISIESRGIKIRYINYGDRLWIGYLLCVDPATGKSVWGSEVRFDNFQLTQGVPSGAPIYLLTRNVTKELETGEANDFLQFVGIDIASGRVAVNYLHPNKTGVRFPAHTTCDPANQQMRVAYYNNEITFDFRESDDIPPQPVACLTNHSSISQFSTPPTKDPIDQALIDSEKEKSLRIAVEAQQLLPQKRAEEKRQLELERADRK